MTFVTQTAILCLVALSSAAFSACSEPDPSTNTPPTSTIDEEIQFEDGTAAVLKFQETAGEVRGLFLSGHGVELALVDVPAIEGLKLRADVCEGDPLEISLPEYPSSLTGIVSYTSLTEAFGPVSSPSETHKMDGTWAVSVSHPVSVTEITTWAGKLPMSGHGALLFSLFEIDAWEAASYERNSRGLEISGFVCPSVGILTNDQASEGWPFYPGLSLKGFLSDDFRSAVVWSSGDVTGTARMLP